MTRFNLLFILILTALIMPAHAGSDDKPRANDDLAAFCGRADYIVHGRVTGRACAQDKDGLIWTTYTVAVADPLKTRDGKTSATLQIRQIGGELGDLRQFATGTPHFRKNEEVILFTRDFGKGFQSVAEGGRGCLRVRTVKTADRLGVTTERRIVPGARLLAPGEVSIDLDMLKGQLRDAIKRSNVQKSESAKEARS